MTIEFGTAALHSASRQTSRLLIVPIALAVMISGCGRTDALTAWQRARSGSVDVVWLSARGAMRHGRDELVIEFRSIGDGKLVDVHDPRATATMPMPGMPMFGSINITATETPGRYIADAQLGMAGTWRFNLQWQGSEGTSSVGFSAAVQ